VNCLRFWLNNAFKTEEVNDTKLVYDEARMTYFQGKVKHFLQTYVYYRINLTLVISTMTVLHAKLFQIYIGNLFNPNIFFPVTIYNIAS
jgi:hypothetical protein